MKITCDVVTFDDGVPTVLGTKEIGPAEQPMNKWVTRPKGEVVSPPMSSALKLKLDGRAKLDRIAVGALGYLLYNANDVQHSGHCAITSGPNQHGHGWSVTPENFHQSMICFASRRLVKATWLNDKDEFNQPDEANPCYPQFADDCVVFALFSSHNHSSSIPAVVYKGTTYDLRNQFFWMTRAEMEAVPALDLPTFNDMRLESADPFVALWLAEPHQLSPIALELVDRARRLVIATAARRQYAEAKFHLGRWDAGWYQLRHGVFETYGDKAWKEFKEYYTQFTLQLRAQVYELGILPRETLLSGS